MMPTKDLDTKKILPRVIFIQIPKACDYSFYRTMESAFGTDKCLRFGRGNLEEKNKYLSMTMQAVRKYHFMAGHLSLPFFLSKPVSDFKVISIIRSPMERELAAYFYIRTSPTHPMFQRFKNADISEYIDYIEQQKLENTQCWFLSEYKDFQKTVEFINEHVSLVVPNDYIGEIYSILEKDLAFPKLAVQKDESLPALIQPEELNTKLLERLQAICSEDQKLYDYVKAQFELKYKPVNQTLSEDLSS